MRNILIILLVAFGLLANGLAPAVDRYVATNGAHSAPYTNWAMAATNIQTAFNVATNEGDTVWVSNGTHLVAAMLDVDRGVRFQSLAGANATILRPNTNFPGYRCFYLHHSNAFLDGFTIACFGGAGVNGGGVFLSSSGTVQNCTIVSNTVTLSGGGVYVHTDSGTVSNCTITDNSAANGGGVFLGGSGVVYGCSILRNAAATNGYGGGLFFNAGGVAYNCTIAGNGSGGTYGGGGVYCGYTNSLLRNCLIVNNTASNAASGGGITFYNVNTIENCTVCSNRAAGYGGGLFCYQSGRILNSIIYSNAAPVGHGSNYYLSTVTVFTNSCTVPTNNANMVGTGNTAANPRFLDWVNGDYRLPQDSPCVDQGLNSPWMTETPDLAGHRRIWNEIVDMGCYEYIGPGIFFFVH